MLDLQRSAVVFILPTLKTGGGNRVFIEIANVLCQRRPVTLLSPNNSSDSHTFFLNSRVEQRSIGGMAGGRVSKLFNILRLVRYVNRHHRGDVVIVSDPFLSVFSCLLRARFVLRFFQSDDYALFDDGYVLGKGSALQLYKLFTRISYRYKGIGFVFNSRFVYDRFCLTAGASLHPYRQVSPALNHHVFQSKGRPQGSAGRITICLVARKHPLKGLDTFLNAWRDLPFECRQNVERVLLISHDDLSAFDLRNCEVIRPASDYDIAAAFERSDIFISTSRTEGFGLPPLEAMACGCAVITSDSGGVNEYAEDGHNCLMYQPGDEDALRTLLTGLISDPEKRWRLGIKGIETAKNFTWEKSARALEGIIDVPVKKSY